ERFILLGVSSKDRMLYVCHCYRDPGDRIRIISARKATEKEVSFYVERLPEDPDAGR
ncbi:MAG: BrnT family toxin, partial [Firmicutes bacterium]|nr:BrnT family toxin [Bacillota bacterium]